MKLKAFLIGAVLVACCNVLAKVPKSDAVTKHFCHVPENEMKVLSAYLHDSVNSREPAVLVTSTEASGIDVDAVNLQLAVRGQGTPKDARDDLKSKDKSACQLGPLAGMNNLKLISEPEHERIFRKGWSEFRRLFGKNARIVQVSRVGFNSRKDIALFYSSGGIDLMAGSCSLYVYQRIDGKWVKKSEMMVWST